jgi:hypothetical protein
VRNDISLSTLCSGLPKTRLSTSCDAASATRGSP